MSKRYQVAIIGSGIAGTTLGAILARHGMKVIIFEAKQHPRFAIGESMILETSDMMRALAEFYDVPEAAYFSSINFMAFAGSSHGVKRHFGFFHHREGEPHNPRHTLQAVIPKEPHGHEFHLYRQDTDYFLMSSAIRYGATVLQNTRVADVQIDEDGVVIKDHRGVTYDADYIVDAGGFRSVLAQKFGLRVRNQKTHARAMFTHMVDVPPVDDRAYGLPFPMSEGTLHHVFEGGWLWVIPFNNHPKSTNPLVSVGLLLDPRLYPQQDDLTAEEEFFGFIKRFPTIHEQLKHGKAVRDWVRAPRIQYGSSRVVGDRWALLGHAAGFIDPLYSKGLYISLTSVFVLAHLLLRNRERGDFSATEFAPLEQVTQNYLRMNDRLVANSYKSWGDYRLWQQYSVLWLIGAYTELVKLISIRGLAKGNRATYFDELVQLQLAGGGFSEFFSMADQVDTIIEQVDLADETSIVQAEREIREIFGRVDWMPRPFKEVVMGKTYLTKNKIRPDIFNPSSSFLGSGGYRQHFFGNHSILQLLRVFARETWRYNPLVLNRVR
ncbi:MAG: NAD(P)/FAD-dependent oxidoreductase [Ardenticatenaceae bacterium]